MKNNNISTSVDGVSKNRETHGVSETFVAKSKIDISLEELQRNGYTTLKNVFSEDECAVAKKKIDKIYDKQIKECGGENYLISINEQNIVRALLAYDEFFLRFANNKSIREILDKCLGKKYILNLQNSPINRAHQTHFGSTWHRDLSYQHFVASRPIAINVLVCFDPFTEENGGTCILPFSHKFEQFPSKSYQEKNEKKITANIGDAFIFNAMIYHRAGANNTDKERKLLVQMFTLPFIKPQVSFPKMLSGKFSTNEELSYLLGYDSETEENVINWRSRRKRRYDRDSAKK